jgi:GDPmannose 4,6-dehydratase
MTRRALITGVTGQDGAYLSKLLLDNNYEVFGGYRRSSSPNFWRLDFLGTLDKIKLIPMDLTDTTSIYEAVEISNPDEVYNAGAMSYVSAAFEMPITTLEIDAGGVISFLEAIRHINPKIKFLTCSSSEMYGNANGAKSANENSPMEPASPYGASKLMAHHINRIYRQGYKLFTCSSICFNHESPIRGIEFVTRKICNSVARIKLGLQDKLELGNVNAKRDWGYSPDYVKAMYMMMQREEPDDFVIATGESHTVLEFVEETFKLAKLDYHDYLKTDKKYTRSVDVNFLLGDYSKAKSEMGWEPKVRFKELVKIMYETDLNRWKRHLKGDTFPWDAPNYSDANIITRALRD